MEVEIGLRNLELEISGKITVKPLLSGPLISGHLVFNGYLSKLSPEFDSNYDCKLDLF